MHNKKIIEQLQEIIGMGCKIVARDFAELERLQTSITSAGNFAFACYKKTAELMTTYIKKNISKFHVVVQPTSVFGIKNGLSTFIPTSLPPTEEELETTEFKTNENIGRFLLTPISSLSNFTRSLTVFSIGAAMQHYDSSNNKYITSHACIYEVANDRWYSATRGEKAFLNERIMKVSANGKLGTSTIIINGLETAIKKRKMEKGDIESLKSAAINVKNLALMVHNAQHYNDNQTSIAYVASGKAEAAICMNIVDFSEIAGAIMMAEESGAIITDLEGNPINHQKLEEINGLVATNPAIHRELIAAIRSK